MSQTGLKVTWKCFGAGWGELLVFWGHLLLRTSPGLAFPRPHGPIFTTVLGRRTTDFGSTLISEVRELRQRLKDFPFSSG